MFLFNKLILVICAVFTLNIFSQDHERFQVSEESRAFYSKDNITISDFVDIFAEKGRIHLNYASNNKVEFKKQYTNLGNDKLCQLKTKSRVLNPDGYILKGDLVFSKSNIKIHYKALSVEEYKLHPQALFGQHYKVNAIPAILFLIEGHPVVDSVICSFPETQVEFYKEELQSPYGILGYAYRDFHAAFDNIFVDELARKFGQDATLFIQTRNYKY